MAEGSSSSVSIIDSIARARHSDSRHQANTAARPGRHGNSSTHWAPSVGLSRTAPPSSILTSTTLDCERTGKVRNARKDIGRDAAPYHDNSQAPEVSTVDNDSAPNHRPVNKPVATVPRPEAHKVTNLLAR